ncbi:hypothetical protein ACFORL_03895 [Legionella dresdenensis]|uniref:Coiled-coil protein n=1 Tax=Legionella dresdenensis TaxID=450200 RepID=A0ABV8CDD9_9GAMM
MSDLSACRKYIDNKNAFFHGNSMMNLAMPPEINKQSLITAAKNQALEADYSDIADQRLLIEQELDDLFHVLERNRTRNPDVFWSYCLYCSDKLVKLYTIYDHTANIKKYSKLSAELEDIILNKSHHKIRKSYADSVTKSIKKGVSHIVKIPTSTTAIKTDVLAKPNLLRLYILFCKNTIASALLLSKQAAWFDKIFGNAFDIDKVVEVLNAPNPVFRALSVGFFAGRLIVNAGLLIKHVFFADDKLNNQTRMQRFKNEMYRRHGDFANDLVWATVNGFTNYAAFFHIAAPTAAWVTAGFLVFDVCLLLWRRYLAEKEYAAKETQYRAELTNYMELREKELAKANPDRQTLLNLAEHEDILHAQIAELDIKRQRDNAYWLFNAAAAVLLVSGFSASLLLTPGVMTVVCYAVCTFAISMYLSGEAFKKYYEQNLRLEQVDIMGQKDMYASTLKEYQSARNEFLITLFKNAVIPGVVITTFAVCWPAAVVLTAAYIAYQLWDSYSSHKAQNPQPQDREPALLTSPAL